MYCRASRSNVSRILRREAGAVPSAKSMVSASNVATSSSTPKRLRIHAPALGDHRLQVASATAAPPVVGIARPIACRASASSASWSATSHSIVTNSPCASF